MELSDGMVLGGSDAISSLLVSIQIIFNTFLFVSL